MLKENEQLQSVESVKQRAFLLWPGIVLVILQWLIRFAVPAVIPGTAAIGVFGGLVCGLAIIIWWAFFSRAPKFERWGAIILMIVILIATSFIIHESISTGMRGMMFYVYAIPILSLAFVVWAVASRRLPDGLRRITMIVTILTSSGIWVIIRSDGITGEAGADFAWRWAETSEEQLLSQSGDQPVELESLPEIPEIEAEWPGFRGPQRNSIITGVQIETDWSSSPPVELWRRQIGPGCSSFAVRGDLFYTQEQRGEEEVVTCYNMNNGKPVWRHSDEARFWDSHAGAGPRSTPTIGNGRVYTLGATGILNVLDQRNGEVIWSRNAGSDTDVEIPGWGFTSSPLVIDDIVVVAAAGTLIAYDLDTGIPRWVGPDGGKGYSSPHLLTIDGISQILLMSEVGATSVSPTDGALLWDHAWEEERIVQPAIITGGELLLSAGGVYGIRRVEVMHGNDGWKVEERWTSLALKPSFNDFVVHKGHAFGFTGPSLVCIDIEDGKRKWRGGRYGGQILLLADQDILLILSEKGELALVEADPTRFTELTRFKAIEGKTWNHPVLTGDIILVRNTQEMVAYRLPLAGS